MQSDLPHTMLNSNKKKDGKEFTYNEKDSAIQRQLEANKKSALRRAKARGEYTTEQLFE